MGLFSWLMGKNITVDELAKKCATPWDLSKWLGFNIRYRPIRDVWQQADVTLKKREGDCIAFAVLTYEVLKKKGFEPHLMELTPKFGEGHVICAFKDGTWKYMSNDTLVNCGVCAENLNDIARFYRSDWEYRECDCEGHSVN